jgi:site-specific DNA-methyltransferase (adenine-specific)
VRNIRGVEILSQVQKRGEKSINTILARDKEFGWTSNFSGFKKTGSHDDIPLHYIRKTKRFVGYISRDKVEKSAQLIDTWKVLVPAASFGGGTVPSPVLGKPLIAENPSVCTQSFLFFYTDTRDKAESILSYYQTRFFRFLVSLRKITQHGTHSTYFWVPLQSWDRIWTDEALYEKYGINEDQQAYIESQVREMVLETN